MAGSAKLQHAKGIEPKNFQVGHTFVRVDTYEMPANLTLADVSLEQTDVSPEDADFRIVSVVEVAGPGGHRQGHGTRLVEVRSEFNRQFSL